MPVQLASLVQVDINLWYYCGVHGLGVQPTDVTVRPGLKGQGVRVEQQPAEQPGGAPDNLDVRCTLCVEAVST